MTDEELDQVRRLLLAFEDVAAWCEQLAELAQTGGAVRPQDETADRQRQVARVLQHLAADRESVGRVRARLGLPPFETPPQLT